MTTAELTKKDKFLTVFSSLDFKSEPEQYAQLRKEAEAELLTLDFPTTKTEYWKYTRLGKITNNNFQIGKVEQVDIKPFLIPNLDANLLVVVNGFFMEELSQIASQNGMMVSSLSKAKTQNSTVFAKHFNQYTQNKSELFLAINNAFHTDGIYMELAKNTTAEKPYHIINITTENNS
ncbi:MAG TPA: hypothetical protein PK833_10265, partial [Vicingus sp.]|nr:hypothetical protein [Vicingus sp.]